MSEGRYALERAASLFRPAHGRQRSAEVSGTEPRLATMYLRDLAARFASLSGSERRRAKSLLARPSDGAADEFGQGYTVPAEQVRRDCTEDFCLHWVDTTDDAPAGVDQDINGIPDWIDTVRAEMGTVWNTTIDGHGYREPKSDLDSMNNGGDERLDLYVKNLHPFGIYGYCTTDDPAIIGGENQFFDASAYCVLDNDYAEYPQPGLPSLQVTAAHEFFHAVQFAYDAFEDVWFMEGTAAWMEDEVYDDINDNYQFLQSSHLTAPSVPLDFGDVEDPGRGLFPYGSFLFWQFLTEYGEIAGDAQVIRAIWENADASPSGRDDYSLRAVQREIAARNWRFRFAFRDFGVANMLVESSYLEGSGYLAAAGTPPLARTITLQKANPRKSGRVVLDHLTTAYASFRPGRGVKKRGARIVVKVDGPKRAAGAEAALVVERKNGTSEVRYFRLNRKGNGALAAPFGKRRILGSVVVLANASARFDKSTCYRYFAPYYSCGGAQPRDDRKTFSFTGRLRQ